MRRNERWVSTDHTVLAWENVQVTHTVLESMRVMDVKELVFSSTSAVYGNADVIPTPELYGPLRPISHYGASKLAAEAFIFSFSSNYGFRSSVFRFAKFNNLL